MKTTILAILAVLGSQRTLLAQSQSRIPQPPFEARIFISKASPYLKDTFTIRLEVVTRGIEIDQGLNLIQLPDEEVLSIFTPFEPLAVNRDRMDGIEVTRRRYRARARALRTGTIELAPFLQVKIRRRVRSMFGSVVQETPVTQPVEPLAIHVRPLPPPPTDFAGIIGDFTFTVEASPRNIAAGDLVTVTTTMEGQGWVDPSQVASIEATSQLRAYPVQPANQDEAEGKHRFRQTVVPLSRSIEAIPALRFSWFHTGEEAYQEVSAGPFPLQYREPETRVIQPERPRITNATGPAAVAGNQTVVQRSTPARLAPYPESLVTFPVPAQAPVEILSEESDWTLIAYGPNRGWIPSAALDVPPEGL